MSEKYTMELNHVANPDIGGGYWVNTIDNEPIIESGKTLKEMQDKYLDWINRNELGSGNVPAIYVYKNKEIVVGWFSYNGRLWEGYQDWNSHTKEIIIKK